MVITFHHQAQTRHLHRGRLHPAGCVRADCGAGGLCRIIMMFSVFLTKYMYVIVFYTDNSTQLKKKNEEKFLNFETSRQRQHLPEVSS